MHPNCRGCRHGRHAAPTRGLTSCATEAFTDPPLARVGLNEREARSRDLRFRVAKLPVSAVLRTWTTAEPRGFMKALVSADDDRILGFTMFGADAGEVMAVVQTAMVAGLPYTGVRDAIYTHPTMAEGLNDVFENVPPPG